jgi:NAD+-dependent farnesol dehydrogenase
MRILLTGGTGYLGGRLAAQLLAAGHHVRLLVRAPARARRALGEGFEFHAGDLAQPSGLDRAVADCDAVIHTAALVKNWVPHPAAFEQVNVAGSWALCEAALAARVAAFVYTSSFLALGPSPDGRPVDETALDAPPPVRFYNGYQSTKHRAARLLRAFIPRGLPLVTVFPGVVFGPGAVTDGNHVGKIVRMLKAGKFPGLVGSGEQRWNMAYVEDVVAGHLAALERGEPGDTFILGGEDRSLAEVAASVARGLGVPAPSRRLPFGVCRVVAALEEMKARLTGIPPQLTLGEVGIYRHDWIYSSRKAVERLGYRITPFEEALRVTLTDIAGRPA